MIKIGKLYKFIINEFPVEPNQNPKCINMAGIRITAKKLKSFRENPWKSLISKDGSIDLGEYYPIEINDTVLVCDIVEMGRYLNSTLDKNHIEEHTETDVIFLFQNSFYKMPEYNFSKFTTMIEEAND